MTVTADTGTDLDRTRFFIDGQWVDPLGSDTHRALEAATGEPLGTASLGTDADIDRAVKAARRALDDGPWGKTTAAERAEVMHRFAAALSERADGTSKLVSQENGMPIGLSTAFNGLAPAGLLQMYAELVKTMNLEEVRPSQSGATLVRREPVGVVGAIAPWNYPQVLAMMKIAPALAAGCTIVLKPAAATSLSAYILAEAFEAADFPPGVFNLVTGTHQTAGALARHPGVDTVSFSGPTKQGRWIASICGAELKPAHLELGGQSAAIILDDADLAKAGDALGRLIFGNAGQTCFAMSRVLVPERRYGDLVDALTEQAGRLLVGDPLNEDTTMGPLASSRRRIDVETRVRSSISEGARVVCGARRPASPVRGYFYEPTVLTDVTPQMPIAREEICGPVATVIGYKDEAEAIRLANDGFGLAATVWTGDPQRGLDIARRTRVGTFGINLYEPDIGSPWGGRGPSGAGSAYGPEGMDAYLTSKSVFLPSFRAPAEHARERMDKQA